MKRKTLQKLKAQSFWALLLVLLIGLSPGRLKAQFIEYKSDESNNILIGTSDSRLMASIYETETTVTMKVKAIGYMKADMVTFAFFYDPEVLKLCNPDLTTEVSSFGLLQNNPASLNAGLTAKGWQSYTTHKNKGLSFISRNFSGHETMRAVLVEAGCPNVTEQKLFVVEAGKVQDVFEVNFKKVNTGQDLKNENIGIGAKTTPIAYQPKFGYDGLFLWYKDVLVSSDYRKINPNLFLYRSGSSISTSDAEDVSTTSALLKGSFKQGAFFLPPSTSILDTTENATSGKGKLNHDTVKQYGFIYSLNNVSLSISEFSDSIKIGSTNYAVPTGTEISAGKFIRGTYEFNIKIVANNEGVADELPYSTTISGLLPHEQYYAWAYMHYKFETSDIFQAVGNRIMFSTSDCVPLLVGTVFTKEEPDCDEATGIIQVNVTGGSGSYLYKINDEPFASYPGGEITGLKAGTYTIEVQDSIQVSCPTVTINNFVLHNGNTDLFVSMTSENATTCESKDGVLYVNVTGGKAPYTYILNGEEIELTDGMITGRAAGVYVLNVTDGEECFATSGEVRINSSESTFDVFVTVDQHTTCLSSIGKVTLTVEGTTEFTYQVDGYPQEKITDYISGTPIEVENLSAGLHYVRVIDSCGGEIVKDFTITNGSNALAFNAVSTNEMLSCDNNLIPGSITLNVTNGALELEYSIDGINFEGFPIGETEVTITGLHQGFYRVVVRDGANCTYEVNRITIEREILTPIHVGTYFTAHEPNCKGTNGAIQMYVTGGSGSYLYKVNNEDFASYPGGLISGLKAGTYTIIVKDALPTACSQVEINNIVIHNANTDLNVSMTSENAQTCNSSDGKLFVTVTGGKPDYHYFLDGNEIPLTHGMIDGKKAGVYILDVKDEDGCVASSGEVRIYADNSDIKLFTEVKDAICGSSTGEIEFYVTGAANYTYQIDGYPEGTGSGTTHVIVSGLSAGLHYIRITDNCGEVVKDFTITNGTDALAFTATPKNEALTCNNTLLPGSITLNVSNGTPNFKYRVDGGAWINFAAGKDTVTITGLHTGVYRVEVIDNTGCTYEVNKVTIEREIFTPIQVGTYYTATEPTCKGTNGAIQMYVTGGSGLYLYKVNNELPKHYPNGLITGLSAGTYTIVVKDSITTGCSEVVVNNIVLHNADTDLNVSMTSENAQTCTSTDGKLFVTVTGGKPDYYYFLDGSEIPLTHGMITGKKAGVYVLDVKDEDGCVASSGEVRIFANQSTINVLVDVTNEAICGLSTGAISFEVSNSASYKYQIDGYPEGTGSGTTPVIVNGLSAGLHYIRITDNCGEIVKDFTITNGENGLFFTATPEKEIYSCDGELKPGSITLNVTNGTPNFKYRVDGGAWMHFAANSTTVKIQNLTTGVYVVEVKDTTGCTYEVNKVTIERETYSQISVGTYYAATEPTCGNDDGEIQMHVTGGSGLYLFKVNEKPYTYYEGGLITGLEAGTYTIKVKDSVQKDCSEVVINNIVLRNGDTDLFASMSSENAQTCVSTDGILNVTVTGGKMPYTYYLNDKENEVVVINGKITGQKAGVYVLNVKDGNDCWTSSGEVHIFADNSNIDVLVEVKKEAFCGSSTGAIQFTVYNSANYTYQIDGFSEGTGSGTTPVIVTGLSAGLHYLRITDDCGELVIDFTITNGTNGLLFTAVPTNETLSCEGELLPGSISLTVNYGMPNYKYRVDGGAWISFAANSNTAIIDNLHSGVYHVEVKDTTGCTYQVNNVAIERETSHGTLITAPVATSPQTFCSSAKVENLQATGVNIKWYLTPTGGNAINPATLLMDTIYYAAQTFGTCESGVRTAVRVILDDDAILEVPEIKTPQALCNSGSLKISDIATNGNTNIVWYENETGGNPLALTAPLAAKKYYATVKAGNCQSAPRIPIVITFTTNNPSAPEIESPQYFCEGAMIGNIAVPNNQILWYNANGELLSAEHLLVHNGKYYAEQKAGSCYSSSRTEVTVQLTAPLAPEMPEKQGICGKATLADLLVTGAGIVWYNAPMYGDKLPLSTELHVGYDYWAAQSSMGDCEGARAKVTITDSCYTVYGTMFPFVYDEGATEFNAEFPVSVKLYAVPAKDGNNPILSILSAGALYTTQAVYYDGTIHIPGTPKDPGSIGAFDNPGETINWDDIGKTPGTPDNTPVAAKGDFPDPPVGMFKFENVKPGSYILEIYRKGYIIRWGEVEIDKHGMSLGHRELIAGDINDDLVVDFADLSWTNAKNASYPDALYDSRFDLNGDGNVDGEDIQILMNNFGAYMGTYEETFNWVNGY